jgi:hypothetical protein
MCQQWHAAGGPGGLHMHCPLGQLSCTGDGAGTAQVVCWPGRPALRRPTPVWRRGRGRACIAAAPMCAGQSRQRRAPALLGEQEACRVQSQRSAASDGRGAVEGPGWCGCGGPAWPVLRGCNVALLARGRLPGGCRGHWPCRLHLPAQCHPNHCLQTTCLQHAALDCPPTAHKVNHATDAPLAPCSRQTREPVAGAPGASVCMGRGGAAALRGCLDTRLACALRRRRVGPAARPAAALNQLSACSAVPDRCLHRRRAVPAGHRWPPVAPLLAGLPHAKVQAK